MADRVRPHTRDGKRVRAHTRRSRPSKKPLLSPKRAWRNFKRAYRHAKRKKKLMALGFGLLGSAELGAWAFGRGAGFMLTTVGVMATGIGLLLLNSTGARP